jgi:hypothetical protein
MKRRDFVSAAFTVISSTAAIPALAHIKEPLMDLTALQYLADFRSGGDFKHGSTIRAMIFNFSPDPSSLYLFRKALSTESSSVRRNIVKLLYAMALACNRPDERKIPVLGDRAIIKILLIEGFSKNDNAQADCAEILHTQCKPGDLAAFNELFINTLQEGNGNYLLLAAKAKTLSALGSVNRMAQSEAWKARHDNMQLVKIAQAALGNTAVEEEYIAATLNAASSAPPAPKNRFYDVKDARDGTAVSEHLQTLGYIGTQRSLLTVCAFLRSPLKCYIPDLSERSVRYAAVDAIRFNFPDERVLYQPESLAAWAAVEQFCREKLSAIFDGPTPDLPFNKICPLHSPGRMKSIIKGQRKPV